MKKRNQLKRFLAMMLACTMVFQQAGISTLAEETTMTETAQTQEQELAAEQSEAESKAAAEAEAQAKAEAEAKAQSEAESKAAAEAEAAKAQSEAESKAAAESEAAKVQSEAESKAAAESEAAKAQSEAESKAAAEATQTEAQTQATEKTTEVPSETATEKTTEAATEKTTEAATEKVTEAATETATEKTTEAVTEASSEATTEAATEAATEEATEAESETETETETEAPKTYFTYEDNRVVITATAAKEANLPQDAEIHADYMIPGTPEFNAAAAALEAAYGGENVELVYVFYDVYFTSATQDGRIEPNADVSVAMTFKNSELEVPEDTDKVKYEVESYEVVHVNNGTAEIVTDNVQVTEDGGVASVGFTTDSFSPIAPVLRLTEVVVEDEDGASADDVTALNAATVSTDLKEFLDNATISPMETDPTGALILRPGQEYKVKLEFSEKTDQIAFDKGKDQWLTYEVPEMLTPKAESGQFSMTLQVGNDYYTFENDYQFEGTTLKVKFNQEYLDRLKQVSNANFWVELKATLAEKATGTEIKFSNTVTKTVKIDKTSSVQVEKNGSYDKTKGLFNYTVTVTATGNPKNVTVTDSIDGTLTTYNASSLKVQTDQNNNQVWYENGQAQNGMTAVPKPGTNGFTYVIPEMKNGEKVTFTYNAGIDYSKLNGNEFTVDETKNTISAKPEGGDESETSHDFDHTEAYSVKPAKNGVLSDAEAVNGKKTIDWTIEINKDCKKAIGTAVINDSIVANPDAPMTYSGDGIVIKKYNAESTQVGTDITVPWSGIVNTDASSWSYTLTEADDNTTPYWYTITYTTEVDVSNTVEEETVKNNVDVNGQETSGTKPIGPANTFGISKSHANASKTGVDWTVKVDIPKCGFNDSFVVTDTIGSRWADVNGVNTFIYDTFDLDSVKVKLGTTELQKGEDKDYTLGTTPESPYIMTITFTKKALSQYFGQSNLDRQLEIEYKTIPSAYWPSGEEHLNTVTATGDGHLKTTTDKYVLVDAEIAKFKGNTNKVTTASDGMPVFQFWIGIKGVNSEPVTITDTFNTEILEYYDLTNGDQGKRTYVGAADSGVQENNNDNKWYPLNNDYQAFDRNSTLSVTSTDTGVSFVMTPSKNSEGNTISII